MIQVLTHMRFNGAESDFGIASDNIDEIMSNINAHGNSGIMNIRTGEIISYEVLKNTFNILESLSTDTEWLVVE